MSTRVRERGGIGRHARLKICCPYGRGGSSPPARTIILLSAKLSIRHQSDLGER